MGGRRWTAGERRLLADLAADGCCHAEVAAELGRTPRAMRIEASRLGVRFQWRQPDQDKRAAVLGLLAKGLSLSAIARFQGRSNKTVWRRVKILERDGLVRRVGGHSRAARYVPV